ncbi:ABC transporter permease [Leifsonia xyli]|uniref:ABC transporter permease n=1 Tax=Leifsonia xyli TaxID=1575 RepID=UPI003D66A08B
MSNKTLQEPAQSAGTSPAAPTRSTWGGVAKRLLPKSYLLLVLVVIIVIGYYVSGDFLTLRNAENVIAAASIVAVLAVGQFFVILTGGIDLSVGSILAMSTVIVALTLQAGMATGLSVAFTLFCCGVAGLINGLLVVWLRIPRSSRLSR